jgi:hypothetical protein
MFIHTKIIIIAESNINKAFTPIGSIISYLLSMPLSRFDCETKEAKN